MPAKADAGQNGQQPKAQCDLANHVRIPLWAGVWLKN
jgi:hypothetical protein